MKVSVIIPTWNRAQMIEKAVRSALDQTIPPLEVLVCDDGSTDNTEEIVKSIKDPRIKWIHGTRGGWPAIPRNRGIRESQGEWLAFLDSDDEWLPEKLEKQLTIANKLNCKAVCSNAFRFIPEKGIEGNLLSWGKEGISFEDLLQDNPVICSSVILHRSLFESVKGFAENPQVIEDYALWLRVAALTDFIYVNEPLVIYRDDAANSVRGTVITDVWVQRKHVFNDFLSWAAGKKDPLLEDYILKSSDQYQKAVRKIRLRKFEPLLLTIKRLLLK